MKRFISVLLAVSLLVSCLFVPQAAFAETTEPVAAADTTIDAEVYNATATSVSIKWAKEEGVSKYTIYRSTGKNGDYVKVAATPGLKFTHKRLSEKKTYYYKIVAKASDGTKRVSNILCKVKVRGKYDRTSPFGVKMTAKQQKQVKNKVAKIVNTEIGYSWPKWKKALAAYYYVQDNCIYAPWNPGEGPATPDTAWGALIDGQAWCSGYAMGYQALCDAMGIKCTVKQEAKTASHVWTVIKLGGKKYKMDPQGGEEQITTKNSTAKSEIAKGSIENLQAANVDGKIVLTWDKSPYNDMVYEVYRLQKFKRAKSNPGIMIDIPVERLIKTTADNTFTDSDPIYIKPYKGYYYTVVVYKDGLKTDRSGVLCE